MLQLQTTDEISESYERRQLSTKRFVCVRWGRHENKLLQRNEQFFFQLKQSSDVQRSLPRPPAIHKWHTFPVLGSLATRTRSWHILRRNDSLPSKYRHSAVQSHPAHKFLRPIRWYCIILGKCKVQLSLQSHVHTKFRQKPSLCSYTAEAPGDKVMTSQACPSY